MLRAVHLHLWANDGDSWENLYLIPIVYTHGNTLQWRSSVCLHGYSHACSRNMNYCAMKFACFLVENRISCACSRVPNGSCFNTDWERCMVYRGKRRHNHRRNTQMGRRRRDHRERRTPQRAYVYSSTDPDYPARLHGFICCLEQSNCTSYWCGVHFHDPVRIG